VADGDPTSITPWPWRGRKSKGFYLKIDTNTKERSIGQKHDQNSSLEKSKKKMRQNWRDIKHIFPRNKSSWPPDLNVSRSPFDKPKISNHNRRPRAFDKPIKLQFSLLFPNPVIEAGTLSKNTLS
jgi:hypothetical protein